MSIRIIVRRLWRNGGENGGKKKRTGDERYVYTSFLEDRGEEKEREKVRTMVLLPTRHDTTRLSVRRASGRERKKKLDQSLSGERFNEDDLILSAAEFVRASKRILTSIAGRESSGENCRQLFPKSRADVLALAPSRAVCVSARISCECTQATTGGQAAPILMCESLGTITTITGPVASHHTIRVRRFPRPRPFTLRANLKRTFLQRRLRMLLLSPPRSRRADHRRRETFHPLQSPWNRGWIILLACP